MRLTRIGRKAKWSFRARPDGRTHFRNSTERTLLAREFEVAASRPVAHAGPRMSGGAGLGRLVFTNAQNFSRLALLGIACANLLGVAPSMRATALSNPTFSKEAFREVEEVERRTSSGLGASADRGPGSREPSRSASRPPASIPRARAAGLLAGGSRGRSRRDGSCRRCSHCPCPGWPLNRSRRCTRSRVPPLASLCSRSCGCHFPLRRCAPGARRIGTRGARRHRTETGE